MLCLWIKFEDTELTDRVRRGHCLKHEVNQEHHDRTLFCVHDSAFKTAVCALVWKPLKKKILIVLLLL